MEKKANKSSFKDFLKLVTTICSWTIFVILFACVVFLFYYFFATKIYATKGEKYEPKVSLYTIVSPSMTPNIKVYDVIVNLKVNKPEDIKINDVITFVSNSPETDGMTMTHRVISVIKDKEGNYSYQTKGDYAPVADSTNVSFNNIIGKVSFKIPQLGRIQFFIANKIWWLILLLIPALYIIIRDLFKTVAKTMNFNDINLRIGTKKKMLYLPYEESLSMPNIEEEKKMWDSYNQPKKPFFSNSLDDDFTEADLPKLK